MGVRYGQWRPLASNWAAQGRLARHDIICLHTMVGSLTGTDQYFRRDGYGGVEAHFGVGGDGTVYQWQDTDYRADANLNGNHRIISIETADHGPEFPKWSGSDVPAWTPAQIEQIAQIIARCCRHYGIPCALVPDSRPERRGIAYHRQGCDPWRVAGGELWSSAYGKVCPGDRRIAQIPQVIDRARHILEGEDELNPDQARMLAEIHHKVVAARHPSATHHMQEPDDLLGNVLALRKMLNELHQLALAPLDYRPHHMSPEDNGLGHILSIRHAVENLQSRVDELADALGVRDMDDQPESA